MKSITSFILAAVCVLLTTNSFSQQVSGGINVADLPFQIYGGHIRLEPTDNFYLEAFGSYRPLAEREALFGGYEREGTVFDLSAGIQHAWWTRGRRYTLGIGPYIQRKQCTGEEQCGGFAIFGCGQLFPERIKVTNIGLRAGFSAAFKNGLYLQTYAGLGISNSQSEEEIALAKQEREVSIEHSDLYAHARIILGWHFNLSQHRLSK